MKFRFCTFRKPSETMLCGESRRAWDTTQDMFQHGSWQAVWFWGQPFPDSAGMTEMTLYPFTAGVLWLRFLEVLLRRHASSPSTNFVNHTQKNTFSSDQFEWFPLSPTHFSLIKWLIFVYYFCTQPSYSIYLLAGTVFWIILESF